MDRRTIAVQFHSVREPAKEDVRNVWLVTMPRRVSVRSMTQIVWPTQATEIVKTASRAIQFWMMAVATLGISIAAGSTLWTVWSVTTVISLM